MQDRSSLRLSACLGPKGRELFSTKCPQRNNLCNLLFIETLIGYLDLENQDVQSKIAEVIL